MKLRNTLQGGESEQLDACDARHDDLLKVCGQVSTSTRENWLWLGADGGTEFPFIFLGHNG